MKKSTGFEIREEERQSWGSIAMVWIGSVICVPALMVGGCWETAFPWAGWCSRS